MLFSKCTKRKRVQNQNLRRSTVHGSRHHPEQAADLWLRRWRYKQPMLHSSLQVSTRIHRHLAGWCCFCSELLLGLWHDSLRRETTELHLVGNRPNQPCADYRRLEVPANCFKLRASERKRRPVPSHPSVPEPVSIERPLTTTSSSTYSSKRYHASWPHPNQQHYTWWNIIRYSAKRRRRHQQFLRRQFESLPGEQHDEGDHRWVCDHIPVDYAHHMLLLLQEEERPIHVQNLQYGSFRWGCGQTWWW